MSTELPIPRQIKDAKRATELVRIWLADNHQVFVVTPNLWDDPATWGLLLVDLAKQVAAAYEAQGKNAAEVLKRLREGFDAEWNHPTT